MTVHQVYSGAGPTTQYAFDGSLAVPMYCLMFQEGDDVRPAASQADQGTELANQTYFAARYAGVAMDSRATTDTEADEVFPIAGDIELEIDCEAATWEVGDKVAAVEAAGGTSLENLKVKKTAVVSDSIGHCTRREGSSSTKVRVRLLSRLNPNAPTA